MSVANRASLSLPSSHEGHGVTTKTDCHFAGLVPSDLFPTLQCGESQDLGELLNPAGHEESFGGDRSMFFGISDAEPNVTATNQNVPSELHFGAGGLPGSQGGQQSMGAGVNHVPPIHQMPYFAHVHPMYQVAMPVGPCLPPQANAMQGLPPQANAMQGLPPQANAMQGLPPQANTMHPQPYYGYYTYYQNVNGNLMTFAVPYAMVTPPSSDSDTPGVTNFAMPAAYSMGAGKHLVSREEILRRIKAVERYKKKKARRCFKKNIRYQMRKDNAEKRVRVKGRFAKER